MCVYVCACVYASRVRVCMYMRACVRACVTDGRPNESTDHNQMKYACVD